MEIKGNGFILREWQDSDITELQRLANNPKIAANLYDRFPSPYTMADAKLFINLKANENPVTSFVIEIDGLFAGTIGIDFRTDVFARSPLIGYWLGEDYWGKGVMTEALKLITAYLFSRFNIMCLQAGVFSRNQASMRALEKAGYSKQGVIKGAIFKNDEVLDEHIYVAYKQ
ncbi:GNAT family N-acetyltransferase [Mucilaginibacter glaciei]|uniref:GNAT family N-acetyltransferase n=1 Tax=Mucilaginibacter glaciei TaxID=2772109 RepID=A0A926NPB5_9SPHI|nr:GNAT family protein [Mucilaginibacter glaciei]MBD1393436.1 GNAT family N-acetyltransferase [Mucilaginibacter glaciei]